MKQHSSFAVALTCAGVLTACGKGESTDAPKSVAANVAGGGSPGSSSGKSGNTAKSGKSGGAALAQAPSRGAEHAVYSLNDNRLSAHLVRSGGLLVNGTSAGFAKYMRFRFKKRGWSLPATVSGERAVTIEGSTGRLAVPLTEAQARGDVRVRMRVNNAASRRVGFRVNGKKKQEVTVELTAGWSIAEVTVPAGAFRAGENEILMFTSKGAPMSLAWMHVGGAGETASTPSSTPFNPFTALSDAASGALILPRDGGLAFYVMVPEKGLVAGDLSDPACTVSVSATTDDGTKATGELAGRGSAADLSALAGKVARLELIATGCDRAELTNAALVVPGAAPRFQRKPAKPKYVILWIMDSLRADRVRLFNPKARPEVPTLEKLAESSAVFTRNYVQGNESKASHASIWTSLYPVNHRYYQNTKAIKSKSTKIDKVMKDAGFYTSGESGNGYIVPRHGFGNTWGHFSNHIHKGGGLIGLPIMEKGMASVEAKKEPWFLYIGTIDTHVAWKAHQPWLDKYSPNYTGRFKKSASGADVGKIATGKLTIGQKDIERIRALYDANVSYQDDLVRLLLEKLEALGIADETMLIITADHGDEQFEVSNRRVGHGSSLRETLVHVPLIIHYPPLFPATRVTSGTEIVDIVPTLADVFGVKADPAWQGTSLLELANGVGDGYPQMTFASQYEEAFTARVGPFKYGIGRGGTKFYNIEAAPDEKHDASKENPFARQMVSDAFWIMRTWNRDWHKSVWGNALNVTPKFAAAVDK